MPEIRVADYRHEIEETFDHAKSADIAVAFASHEGLRFGHIEDRLAKLLKAGGAVRILIDLRLANTHPDFLARVMDWQAKGLTVECRHYKAAHGIFHPKVYIFRLHDDSARVIAGSANWTGDAYSVNVEYGLVLEGAPDDVLVAQAQQFFNELWESENAKTLDPDGLNIYRAYWRRRQGLERKARRRAGSIWARLEEHLAAAYPPPGFRWPGRDASFLLGALAARGAIDRPRQNLSIHFRYGGAAYCHNGRYGYIGKGQVGFEAAQVVPLVPEAVAARLIRVVAPAAPVVRQEGKWTYSVDVDCRQNPQLLDELRSFFGVASDYRSFQIPRQLFKANREFQDEFVRGYALACGLVSEGTYDPTYNHQVWLRPATANKVQFDQLADLLENSMGIAGYRHWRPIRDVEIKIRCEAFLEIGFGVDWLDALVEEGARLNEALA